jgi:hypothetical protein
MKNLIYLFILTSGIISCSSDDETGIDNSQLIGKWNWISSCGGFTGGCWFPDENNFSTVEFTQNMYIKKSNGLVETETSYAIVDKRINGDDVLFTMELGNGRTLRFRFINTNLSIEGGDFWSEYERIME